MTKYMVQDSDETMWHCQKCYNETIQRDGDLPPLNCIHCGESFAQYLRDADIKDLDLFNETVPGQTTIDASLGRIVVLKGKWSMAQSNEKGLVLVGMSD